MHPRSIHHVFPYHTRQIADDDRGWWRTQLGAWPVAAAVQGRFADRTTVHVIGDGPSTDPRLVVHRGAPAGPATVPFGCDVAVPLLRALRRLGPDDVCMVHGSDIPAGVLCAEAARRSQVVAVYHGGATGGRDRLKDLAARHVVLRPEVATTLVDEGYPPSAVVEVTPSISPAFLEASRRPSTEGTAVVGWVGRPTWGKGVDSLVPVVRRLAAEGLAVEVDLVGGTHLDHADDLAADVRAAGGRLRWRGFVPNDELPGIMADWDVLLFPSRFEGCGRSPLEAAAMGLPVVSVRGVLPGKVVGGASIRAVARDAVPDAVLGALHRDPSGRRPEAAHTHAAGAAELDEVVLGLPSSAITPAPDPVAVARALAKVVRHTEPLLRVARPVARPVRRLVATRGPR